MEKGLNTGNKAFLVLIAAAIVLGLGLGGAFAAGVAVGRSQDSGQAATSTDTPAFTPPSAPAFAPAGAQRGLQDISPEQLEQFRQQIGEGGGLPLGGGGLAARALTGDIENIDGDVITINTPQGPLQATLSDDTGIQVVSEGTLQDLETGQQVVIRGERNEEGMMEATEVLVTPERDLFGGGLLGAGGARRLP